MRKNKVLLTCAVALTLTLAGGCLAACNLTISKEDDASKPDTELSTVFDKYETRTNWNFSVKFSETHGGVQSRTANYDYLGRNVRGSYQKDGKNYTDYIGYDVAVGRQFYRDTGDGSYSVYKQGTVDFIDAYSTFYEIDPSALGNYSYTKIGDHYSAKVPDAAGDEVVKDDAWDAFDVYISDGLLDKIVAQKLSGDKWTFTFSDYGKVNFTLPKVDDEPPVDDPVDPPVDDPDDPVMPDELAAVVEKFANRNTWNFAVEYEEVYDGDTYSETYEYLGYNVKNTYDGYDPDTEEYLGEYTDYLGYDNSTKKHTYFSELDNGSYEIYDEGSEDFEYGYALMRLVDLSALSEVSFTKSGSYYVLQNPETDAEKLLGIYQYAYYETLVEVAWTDVKLYISNGNITKIVAELEDTTVSTYTFSNHGKVSFTLPKVDGGTTEPDEPDPPIDNPDELSAVIEKYKDASGWNFVVEYEEVYNGDIYAEATYEYFGYNVKNTYEASNWEEYTDYLGYDKATGKYVFYYENDDHSGYVTYAEGSEEYESCYIELRLVDLSALSEITFTKSGSYYVLQDPETDAEKLLGEYYCLYEDDEYYTYVAWTDVKLYISNGNITKIEAEIEDGSTMTYTFSDYGNVSFTLPGGSSTDPVDPDEPDPPVSDPNMMTKQTYDAATFDDERLQDKMKKDTSYNGRPSIGLPSKGTYHALVVPVQFKGDTISSTQLSNLNKAFNGTSADTGWQSVSSYYRTASNGLLNLTFDVQSTVYQAKNTASYYEGIYNGSKSILKEVLAYYEKTLDLSKYDTNNDGYIDAIYLIYSAPVDYSNDSFYWAYVTWTEDNTTRYDGKLSNYYLFAGFDFMEESTSRQDSSLYDNYPVISGLKINASTFIHETGHLLGLDDYYDYEAREGSNEGLGGADMMDYTVGDQNVYSKIMLGWLDATIVNETKTITIQPSAATPSALLIPLEFNNSYFSEYLLIDLYSATGLNEMHANMTDTFLYDGAKFGARIYHVSSSINNPYADDGYGSFTDCNNSVTANALIKLVEADGDKKFSSGNGYAEADDLWQTGGKLSAKFPSYTRNDGKKVNFDISFDSVTSTSATITVTFKN